MYRAIRNTKNFIRYYYRLIIICLILASGLIFSRAYALTDEQYEDSNGITQYAYRLVDDVVGQDSVEEAMEAVTVAFDDAGVTMGGVTISGVGDVLGKINDIALVLGVIFVGMTFLISLLNMREQDIVEEEVFKRMVFLGIGIVMCVYAKPICMALANVGSGVAQLVAGVMPESTTEDIAGTIKDYMYEQTHMEAAGSGWFEQLKTGAGNIGRGIGFVLQLWIPSLIMKIANIIVNVICWSRAIEILILAAFSPLAFADIIEPNNLSSSPGIRFIKNFFALSLSGAFIVTIMIMCQSISSSLLALPAEETADEMAGFADITWRLVTVGIAEVGLVMKANSLAKAVLGLG